MITEILIGVVVIAAGAVLFLASRKPDEMRVERTITIDATPEQVFPYMSNLEKGQAWSPWVEMEPDAKYVFEGPKEGKDATISWEGNKTGKGTLTILEVTPPTHVRMRLAFEKPMQGVSTVEYTLEPEGNQTKVIWLMYGPNSFMAKVMSVFMDCEKMCAEQFDKGLENLKNLIEKPAKSEAA